MSKQSVITSAARDLAVRPFAERARSLAALVMTTGALAVTAVSLGAQSVPAGGSGMLYVGTYGRQVLVLDEATMQVRDSIKTSIGIPSLSLSFNRKNLYVTDPRNEKVEIIDLASKRSVGNFTLSNDSTTVQFWGFALDPKERFAVLLVKTYTKHRDRYEIGRPTLLRYDLAKRAVTDTIPWPKGEERENAQIIFSPNSDLMYFLTGDDVLIYDSNTLKEVDRWEISKTLFEEGLGRINFGFPYDVYEEPGFYTGLFRTTDPVNRRTQMGVARMDLANRQLEYYPLGPNNAVSFRLAPDQKRAYGIHSEIGNYQFWTFDLESRRVLGKTEFEGRPRMGLIVGSNGSQLYITTAGSTIDRYSTADFKHLGTVNLGADMTNVILVPAPRSTSSR
jgi:DNA-binding beta-propeller fold protein YncE